MSRKEKIINIVREYTKNIASAKRIYEAAKGDYCMAIADGTSEIITAQQANILNQAQKILADLENKFENFMMSDWDEIKDD